MQSYALAITLFMGIKAATATDVNLTIYYESLCPASIATVVHQLYPAWTVFGAKLNVLHKPFGKANWTETDDAIEFTCQHGEDECYGNMAQACLLHLLPAQTNINPVIYCMMNAAYPPVAGGECIEELASPTSVDALMDCIRGSEGPALLRALGVETHSLVPALTSVPWITFNGVYNADDHHNALNDLKGVLCSKYLQSEPECKTL